MRITYIKETDKYMELDHDSNVKCICDKKSFLKRHNSDLIKILKTNVVYETKYHDRNKDGSVQLDFNI